jgi:hypothetical protein
VLFHTILQACLCRKKRDPEPKVCKVQGSKRYRELWGRAATTPLAIIKTLQCVLLEVTENWDMLIEKSTIESGLS